MCQEAISATLFYSREKKWKQRSIFTIVLRQTLIPELMISVGLLSKNRSQRVGNWPNHFALSRASWSTTHLCPSFCFSPLLFFLTLVHAVHLFALYLLCFIRTFCLLFSQLWTYLLWATPSPHAGLHHQSSWKDISLQVRAKSLVWGHITCVSTSLYMWWRLSV